MKFELEPPCDKPILGWKAHFATIVVTAVRTMSLQLERGKPRTLAYAPELRHDLKLLEVSEDLLEELRISGCVP